MKTTLVLETDGEKREALQKLLRDNGYTVTHRSEQAWCLDMKAQRAEQHFRGIYEKGPLGIFCSDLDGKLLSINPAGARMCRYDSPEEMIETINRTSIPDAFYVNPGHRQDILAEILNSQDWHVYEEQFRCKDGSVIDCYLHIRATRDVHDGPIELEGFLEDISERKRREEALRFTQFAIDNSIDQAFWINEAGRLLYVNDAACAALGYSREKLLQMSIPDIGPTFPAEVYAEHWRELKKKGSLAFESLHRAKNGRVYPVEIRANYVVFDGKEYICAFATDISERKRQQQALRLTQFAVDNSANQAFWTTPDGRLFYVNEAACTSLGYSRKELLGMSVSDIDADFSPERLIEHWQDLRKNGSKRFESRHRTRDGRVYPVEVHSNYVNFDGREYLCTLVTDISERKAAEEALRQANLIVENSPAVLLRWRATEGWPVEMVSRNVSQFGYTPEELSSGALPLAGLVHPEDLDRVVAEVREHIGLGKDRFKKEYRIVTKSGEVRWIDARTVIERNAEGRVTHYQGIFLDITDRKQTENIITARMRLLQFAATHTLEELLEATLNEAEELTESHIGFYHFLEEDQQHIRLQSWSTRTKRDFCKAQGKGLHYPVSEAGVWIDCIHQRQPVIHNDYATLPHRKGMPAGHAKVTRELVVPVFRREKIVAILGVGNKSQAYTQQDVETVSLLADLAWTIVENKKTEQALRESERRYRSIVEHAPFGISHSTKDGQLISVNPALAAILKYDSAEELRQTVNRSSIQDVLFPAPSKREALVEQIFAGDSWHVFDNRLLCKDGSVVTCRVHSRPILDQDGKESGFESFQENITDQLAAEEALRKSEEKFRVLAETSPAPICIYREDKVLYANPAMKQLLGTRPEDLGQRNFWDWAPDDFRETIRMRGQARLQGKPAPRQYECRFISASGEEKFVMISAGTIEFQGRTAGVASFLDITEHKRTEELIRASLAEKEVLLREIHHRVKNNLQVVSSLLFLQSQKFRDPDLQNCFLESQSRICSMALAHEQLYQSKNLADVSIQTYVENLVVQLQQILKSPEQKIDCHLEVEDVDLDIEKVVPCGLLITELLSNAYKHAFIDGRNGHITITIKANGSEIILAVADNGVGMPAELDYRQARTLGLQLVTALANQLNGTLELKRGYGTLFQVRFTG